MSKFCFREYARTIIGKRIHGLVPGRKFTRINVVAGYCDGRILGEYCHTGSMTAQKFEDWFCGFLLPLISKGDVIIMDNASWHNKKRLREYVGIYKVTIIFLPPYSPDYSPIENVWANMKRFLRHHGHRFQTIQNGIYWYFAFAFS